jgi:uncharacterized protein GlcG (DUF336 family)
VLGVAVLGTRALAGSNSTTDDIGHKGTKLVRVLTQGRATQIARGALVECRKRGFPVTVTIVDRDGVDLVVLRDADATGATVATARGKAVAAAGFRSNTSDLDQGAKQDPGLLTVPDFVLLAGGRPITSGKQLLGGIGVSGAPSGDIDDACARAGLGG